MIDTYKLAIRDCHYTATYFLRLFDTYGGVGAAKRLPATDTPSDGFTRLWECDRLDLTVEAHVIRPEYASLFTEQEIQIARNRLVQYGFTFDA